MKNILHSLLVIALLASAYSCNDDKDPITDPPDPPEPGKITYSLYQGLGILEDIDEEGLSYYSILLSSIPAGEDRTFDGAGQALYLELVGPSINYPDEIGLPAGTYKYSTSSDKALSIVSGTGSRFEHLDVDGKATSYGITEGEIVVTETSGRYNISGTVKSSTKDSVFTFKFDSNIAFTDEYKNGEFNGEFTAATVYYRNKYYGTPADNYIITFTSDRGHTANIEIITPGVELHTMVPEGTYTFARSQISTYNLLGQEDTYVIWGKNAEQKGLDGGEIEIENNGDGTFTVTGNLTPEDGEPFDFIYNGRLKLEKMRMIAYDVDFLALGAYWARHASQFDLEFYFQSDNGFTASTIVVISTPYIWWYEFWPLPAGVYPYHSPEIRTDADVNVFHSPNSTFITRSKSLNYYQDYVYSGGSFDIKHVSGSGTNVIYSINGTTTAILKQTYEEGGFIPNLYQEEGDELEIEIIYQGIPGYFGAKEAGRPQSKLEDDIQVNDFAYLIASYIPDYWHDELNVSEIKSNCLTLYLETEYVQEREYEWEEDDYFMYIDLNIPLDAEHGRIPSGTYTPNYEFTYEPFTYNLGWDSNYQFAEWGTFIYTFDEWGEENFGRVSISPNDLGSVVISSDGQDEYTININVYDDQGRRAKKISGTFQGPLDAYVDYSRSNSRGNDGKKKHPRDLKRMNR